jgi:hypothetical protein
MPSSLINQRFPPRPNGGRAPLQKEEAPRGASRCFTGVRQSGCNNFNQNRIGTSRPGSGCGSGGKSMFHTAATTSAAALLRPGRLRLNSVKDLPSPRRSRPNSAAERGGGVI